MIQLYNPTNTDFEQNGDCVLTPSLAKISAELNGAWTATIDHPLDDEGRWKLIQDEAVVKMPSFNGDQLFRIKKKTKTDIKVSAILEPIFLDAMDDCFLVDIRPTGKTGQEALDLMTAPNSKYTGQSNITRTATAYYEYKNLIEAINGNNDNSFINRWGGEIYYDNFEVIINERIGSDNGVEIRYGKNIPQNGFSEDVDMRDVVTRIYPKAYNGHTMNGHVDSPLIDSYPTIKTATITFSNVKMREDATADDEEKGIIVCDTQEELNTALTDKCNETFENGADKPKVTINAEMVLLQNCEEYKEYQIMETVGLGDTIHCVNNHIGVKTDARVISLTYDAIQKKTTSVVVGDYEYNYFNNVTSSVNRIDTAIRPDGTVIGEQVQGFIDGALAQLRLQNTVAKKQDVRAILFEDTDPDSPTFGAMSLGTQGLQISKKRNEDNTDWLWSTALTASGLIADVIVAGILSDKEGKSHWNLNTGEMVLSGIFQQFSNNGKLAMKMENNQLKIYAWHSDGDEAGAIGSLKGRAGIFEGRTMMSVWCDYGNVLSLGYKNPDDYTEVKRIMSYDTTKPNDTPWIINTSNGTLFGGLAGGGVTVENGLIKKWNMAGAYTGWAEMETGSSGERFRIETQNGLVTSMKFIRG